MNKKRLKKLEVPFRMVNELFTDNFPGKTFIFGYGSLVGESGINGRGMGRIYTEGDLKEVVLRDYKREINACSKHRMSPCYYGISYKPGETTNGVIFELDIEDSFMFRLSEGFGFLEDRPYNMVDVTHLINYDVGRGNRILTCVTRNKRDNAEIYVMDYYRLKIKCALKDRSAEFKRNFWPKI